MAKLDRRSVLLGGTALIGLAAVIGSRALGAGSGPVEGTFEVTHTDEEWLAILGPEAFEVMRRQGTEYPWTSALLEEHREGMFICAGCELRAAAVRFKDQVRQRHGLAELLPAARQCCRHDHRHAAGLRAHGSPLPPLRRPPRPRVRRRPAAHRSPLLHGRRVAEVRTARRLTGVDSYRATGSGPSELTPHHSVSGVSPCSNGPSSFS
jgi:hypothetical protein